MSWNENPQKTEYTAAQVAYRVRKIDPAWADSIDSSRLAALAEGLTTMVARDAEAIAQNAVKDETEILDALAKEKERAWSPDSIRVAEEEAAEACAMIVAAAEEEAEQLRDAANEYAAATAANADARHKRMMASDPRIAFAMESIAVINERLEASRNLTRSHEPLGMTLTQGIRSIGLITAAACLNEGSSLCGSAPTNTEID